MAHGNREFPYAENFENISSDSYVYITLISSVISIYHIQKHYNYLCMLSRIEYFATFLTLEAFSVKVEPHTLPSFS